MSESRYNLVMERINSFVITSLDRDSHSERIKELPQLRKLEITFLQCLTRKSIMIEKT